MRSLYFRQLLAGRDFATANAAAAQMVNFCYLIGDRTAGSCLVVDPAWDVEGLLAVAAADGMTVEGALVTHYHPDHVGGDLFGLQIEGLARLQELQGMPVHCNRHEAYGIRVVTELSESDLTLHEAGDVIQIGEARIELVHTPGHTPGSQCFLVDGMLVSGDTLFVGGCGRVDLPGSDPEEMYRTLTQRLAKLPAETILYPGHHYGPSPTSTLAIERRQNYSLQPRSVEEWMGLMNG